jgi:hypothetical protein
MINSKYKRLVVYGCSFTAGEETGDEKVLGMPHEEIDELKRNGMTRAELYGKGKLNDECTRVSKTLAWPRWLADIFNVPYSNRAYGGGSLQQMVYRIERDYHNGLTNDDDLVLVGLTSMYRWFHMNHAGNEHSWVFNTTTKHKNPLYDELVEYYVNPYNICWEYHKCLTYMQMLSEKRKNIWAINAISPYSVEYTHDLSKLNKDFTKTINNMSINYPFILQPEYGMTDIYKHLPTEEVTHGWGHPKVKYHQEYAKILAEVIRDL